MNTIEMTYPSADGKNTIFASCMTPDTPPRAVIQVAHGIAEHIGRYTDFADYCTQRGYAVAGNDHIGHGRSMKANEPYPAYFGPRGSWQAVCADTAAYTDRLRAQFPGLPICLLGFSLGSFVVRTLLIERPQIVDFAVLAGTGHVETLARRIALMLAAREEKRFGDKCDTPLLHKLTMDTYNAYFKPCRTGWDWLCATPEAVDAFIADPLCGDGFTVSAFRELMGAIGDCTVPARLARMNPDLPILLVSGDQDPFGEFGKGEKRPRGYSQSPFVM